jgi:hypothetical protein
MTWFYRKERPLNKAIEWSFLPMAPVSGTFAHAGKNKAQVDCYFS